VHRVEFAIGGETRAGEVTGADDSDQRVHAVEHGTLPAPAAIQQVGFGVQKVPAPGCLRLAPVVQPHSDLRPRQEADQIADQFHGGLVERLLVEIRREQAPDLPLQRDQAEVSPFADLRAQQQAEAAQALQPVRKLLVATHAEVGRRDVHRLHALRVQQVAQHVGQPVFLVIDDVRNAHCESPGFITPPRPPSPPAAAAARPDHAC